jgi:hypothetical protein
MNSRDPASPRLSDFLCFAIYSANLAYGRAYKPILEELEGMGYCAGSAIPRTNLRCWSA